MIGSVTGSCWLCRKSYNNWILYFLKAFDETLSETIGTPEYLSPEAKRSCIGLKTDYYSVGQMINEILFNKIAPKEEVLSSRLQELKNMVQVFGYRLQGKNEVGAYSLEQKELEKLSPSISVKDTDYFKKIYLEFRPHYTEFKLFFDSVKAYMNILNELVLKDDLISIKNRLQHLAYPDISFNISLASDNYLEDKEIYKNAQFLKCP